MHEEINTHNDSFAWNTERDGHTNHCSLPGNVAHVLKWRGEMVREDINSTEHELDLF